MIKLFLGSWKLIFTVFLVLAMNVGCSSDADDLSDPSRYVLELYGEYCDMENSGSIEGCWLGYCRINDPAITGGALFINGEEIQLYVRLGYYFDHDGNFASFNMYYLNSDCEYYPDGGSSSSFNSGQTYSITHDFVNVDNLLVSELEILVSGSSGFGEIFSKKTHFYLDNNTLCFPFDSIMHIPARRSGDFNIEDLDIGIDFENCFARV